MKITIENDQETPFYVSFGSDADYNLDPGASIAMEIVDGSELLVKSDHIETKNIKRP